MLEIISLIENFATSKDFNTEHGLALFVKQDDKNYLIDTGATNKFLTNAEKMNVDLKNLDGVIISHNHCDHIGGLSALLEYNKNVKVYIKNASKGSFYYRVAFLKKYIGEKHGLFENYKDRFVFFDEELQISTSFKLHSNTNQDEAFFCKDKKLLEKKNGRYKADKFKHELFAVFEEPNGLVIISSCSHNGIVNIIKSVKEKYNSKPILNIVGGFHMMGFGLKSLNCSQNHVKEVATILASSCEKTIFTCHCTGKKAFEIMNNSIGEKISYFNTGQKIIIS